MTTEHDLFIETSGRLVGLLGRLFRHRGFASLCVLACIIEAIIMAMPPYAIGLAVARLDGFAAIEAGDEPGTLTTKPLVLTGTHLVINAECGEDGHVAVEIIDHAGTPLPDFSLDRADHITGDSIRALSTWKDNPDIGKLNGRPLKLRFHLRNARLYSFAVVV